MYKFLHKASAVLQSSNNVTAGIAAHVQDRATVLSYLSNIAYSAVVGYHTYIHAYMHTHVICIYMHTHPNKHWRAVKYSIKYIYNIRIYIYPICCMVYSYILYYINVCVYNVFIYVCTSVHTYLLNIANRNYIHNYIRNLNEYMYVCIWIYKMYVQTQIY